MFYVSLSVKILTTMMKALNMAGMLKGATKL
jgi:hypothetical protein